jgi:hypothetical protein
MKFFALAACVVLTAGAVSAATTFANIDYNGTKMIWGSGCTTLGTACPADVDFNYVGGANNNLPPYNSTMAATFTYDWAPIGPAEKNVYGPGSYDEYVTGYFVFSYGGVNLLTVDFSGADAILAYSPLYGDLSLILNSTTSGGVAPTMSSDILTIVPALTDWAVNIDFGNQNPGVYTSGPNNGDIKNFKSTWNSFTVGATPFPGSQVPEPASMLMAGAGLLSTVGLLSLRKRLRK